MNKFIVRIRKIIRELSRIAYDSTVIPIAWYTAYWLRYNMHQKQDIFTSHDALFSLKIYFIVQVCSNYYFKIHKGLWRFFSLGDLNRILKASAASVVLVIPILYISAILSYIPRAVFPLYGMSLVILLCSGRLIARFIWGKGRGASNSNDYKKVLIIGAGQAGEGLLRDLKQHSAYKVLGFIDDDIDKHGLEIHGIRVLGATHQSEQFVKALKIDIIFIAIPSASSALMRRIVAYCEKAHIPFSTLPGISALAAGRVEVNALRAVCINDLLGRDTVTLQWDEIIAAVRGKRVLITGGGGSIGSELCRQVYALNPASLAIVDNCEFNLYKIDQELQRKYSKIVLGVHLINVSDAIAINHLFEQYQPEIVLHAAAYKHVPMLQNQIRVAVQNNIIGTKVVAEASVTYNVDKFVLISTDKAVNPTNIMGATKRVAEIYCQNLNRRVLTQFITVRFGNVLGSAGSVIPLFQKQLQTGGPLTVTHPEMQRYFMTIPEASQLILQAMANGQGGEIFVLDMGEPIKISYLAEQMIRLAGKEPGKDIQIKYTGLRPGEKLYEELFYESEQLITTNHEKLFKAKFCAVEWSELDCAITLMNRACSEYNSDKLLNLLKQLVVELQVKQAVLSDVNSL